MIAATKFREQAESSCKSFERSRSGRLLNTLLLEGDGLMPVLPRSR